MLYTAPEVLQHQSATPASEVFSYGVVLFELCRGVPMGFAFENEFQASPCGGRGVGGRCSEGIRLLLGYGVREVLGHH